MKKIATLLLAFSFFALCVTQVHSAPRTDKKETVKTELSKIVKAEVVKQVLNVSEKNSTIAAETVKFNPLEIAELNRPPGFNVAYANDVRSTDDAKSETLHRSLKYNWQLNPEPNLGRTI